jgi:hypothetical protein
METSVGPIGLYCRGLNMGKHPLPWEEKGIYQPMSFGGINMKRGREKGKCEEKGKEGKEKRKMESKKEK